MGQTTIQMKRSDALMVVKRSLELGKIENALAILNSLIEQEEELEKDE